MKRLTSALLLTVLCLTLVLAIPQIIDSGNPADATTTENKSVELNFNITEANLQNVTFNWNGTNYSIFDDNLVLAYNFNNLSVLGENDTHVVDISGNGNNGTVVGGENISWTPNGKYGGAFNFTNVTAKTNNIALSSSSQLNITGDITLSAWVYTTESPNSYMTIAGKRETDNWDGFALYHWGESFHFAVKNSDISSSRLSTPVSSNSVSYNVWQHVVGVYNSSSNQTEMYLNGILKSSKSSNVSSIKANDDIFRIGRADWWGETPHKGMIDEVRIWNRSLSAIEIEKQYYANVKKFDSDKYTLYVNETMPINTTGTTNTYYACSTNTSNDENCTSELSITRLPESENITSNFTSIYKILPSRGVYGISASLPTFGNSTNNWYNYYDTDCDGQFTDDTLKNRTWLKDVVLDLNAGWIRSGISLSPEYQNTSDTSGVNFSQQSNGAYDDAELAIKWAYENDINILLQITDIPSWLVDNSSGTCNGDTANEKNCTPSNYTKYANIINDSLYRITNEFEYINNIYIEILNEPASWDSRIYVNHFNNITSFTKPLNSDFKFGGTGACTFFTGQREVCLDFLANATGNDFVSIHDYPDSYLGSTRNNNFVVNLNEIIGNCSGANCSMIIQSEGNIAGTDIKNLTSLQGKYGANIGTGYVDMLNFDSFYDVQYIMYQLYEEQSYDTCESKYPEHPAKWEMLSPPELDNKYHISYNVTKNFATYHSAGSTVYHTSSTDSLIKVVSSKLGNTHSITLINTDTEPRNVTIITTNLLMNKDTGEIVDAGDMIGEVIDGYGIQHWGTPTLSMTLGTNLTKTAISGESYTGNEMYFSVNNLTIKHIASTIQETVNANVTFPVDNCGSIGNIKYTSDSGDFKETWNRDEYTCSNNEVTLSITGIEPSLTSNELEIDYSCNNFTRTGFNLVMIIASVMLIFYLVTNITMEGVTLGKIVVIFINLIVILTLWLASGQSLGGLCPVS